MSNSDRMTPMAQLVLATDGVGFLELFFAEPLVLQGHKVLVCR